jgi:hypothetical protein
MEPKSLPMQVEEKSGDWDEVDCMRLYEGFCTFLVRQGSLPSEMTWDRLAFEPSVRSVVDMAIFDGWD